MPKCPKFFQPIFRLLVVSVRQGNKAPKDSFRDFFVFIGPICVFVF
jgi:hypothetical protein